MIKRYSQMGSALIATSEGSVVLYSDLLPILQENESLKKDRSELITALRQEHEDDGIHKNPAYRHDSPLLMAQNPCSICLLLSRLTKTTQEEDKMKDEYKYEICPGCGEKIKIDNFGAIEKGLDGEARIWHGDCYIKKTMILESQKGG